MCRLEIAHKILEKMLPEAKGLDCKRRSDQETVLHFTILRATNTFGTKRNEYLKLAEKIVEKISLKGLKTEKRFSTFSCAPRDYARIHGFHSLAKKIDQKFEYSKVSR